MKTYITKQEAFDLLRKYNKTPHIIDHSYEAGVVMSALAKHFGEDEDLWFVIGLLHDLDLDTIGSDYSHHGEVTKKILEDEGYDLNEIVDVILSHTECLEEMGKKYSRKNRVDFCLGAAEQVTGLITAYARMRPTKFDGMKAKSLNKKFKDRAFAANVNREFISDIEKVGLGRSEFFTIAIDAISSIADEINV